MHAGIHAGADRGHRLRLGEDLRVRTDADFQVLAPRALLDQHLLQVRRLRPSPASASPDRRRPAGSPRRGSPPRRSGRRARAPRSRARSSTATNVTPAALIACRSIGASSHGLPRSRRSGGVLASTSSSAPMRSPLAARRRSAGASASHRSRMVGKLADMSNRSPSRTATTDGPPTSGPPDASRQRGLRAVVRQHGQQRVTKCGHPLSSQSQARHPILCPAMNPRRQAHAAVRLVAHSGHRDVSGHPHRGGVAREAVARAVPGAAQAWHRARRHQPAERGKAARQVRLRRLRAGAVRLGHQVRKRHRLAELLPAAGRRGRHHRGPQLLHDAHRGALQPTAAVISATCSTTARARPGSATA